LFNNGMQPPRRPPLAHSIRRACLASKTAYSRADQTPDVTDKLITGACTDAQVLISRDADADTTIVAFRGTTSAMDWNMNSRMWLVPSLLDPQARVHAGFWLQWESVKREVHAAVTEFGSKKLIVTGHSLGAGVAHVACTDFASMHPSVDLEVITFAGPRPGNRVFGTRCRERCPSMLRVVYDNDIVPTFPARIFGFDHGDCECLTLHDDGTFTVSVQEDGLLLTAWSRFLKLLTFDAGVRDHDIDHYLAAIDAVEATYI
jgi:predicted lipase